MAGLLRGLPRQATAGHQLPPCYWQDASSLALAPSLTRSANVYRAYYNGEIIAAKEIEVERSQQMLEAFLTEAQRLQVGQGEAG